MVCGSFLKERLKHQKIIYAYLTLTVLFTTTNHKIINCIQTKKQKSIENNKLTIPTAFPILVEELKHSLYPLPMVDEYLNHSRHNYFHLKLYQNYQLDRVYQLSSSEQYRHAGHQKIAGQQKVFHHNAQHTSANLKTICMGGKQSLD